MADAAAAAAATAADAVLLRKFSDFLDGPGFGAGPIMPIIEGMLERDEKRLIVNIDELRAVDPALARALLTTPVTHLPVLEKAFRELAKSVRPSLGDPASARALSAHAVGLSGAFGGRRVSPGPSRAPRRLGGLVKSVHYCPATKATHEKVYRDNAALTSMMAFSGAAGVPGSAYPRVDGDGNPLETEYGACWYRDSQRLTIQEMPETAPAGQLPRSVDVLVEADLVDRAKPGDRIDVVGVYRAVSGAQAASGTGVFKTLVVAVAITQRSAGGAGRTAASASAGASDPFAASDVALALTAGDVRNVRKVAAMTGSFSLLARSIAPSICGADYIKRALLLLLVGGAERNLANGTHLRGDINVLLVGDPSTAKSQLLRFILHTAPLALSTTGRGSSGVGLTAAVTSDPDTGERALEAGAMVLADRGVVCIDEFDKMNDEDRVAIHEVMEQQTVTIAKAGIHASLNARCSVVAAANPLYGSYDRRRKPHDNIALPDSLLSRFDLLFIVLDAADAGRDAVIADHVLRAHRYRAPVAMDGDDGGAGAGGPLGGDDEDDDGTSPVWERSAQAVYAASAAAALAAVDAAAPDKEDGGTGGNTRAAASRRAATAAAAAAAAANSTAGKVLSLDFVKKYVHYAKSRHATPTLTPAAASAIAGVYRDLRSDSESIKTLPITPRVLETLIRLATAHAKLRLAPAVEAVDAAAGAEVPRYALFNQAAPHKGDRAFRAAMRARRAAARRAQGGGGSAEDDDDSTDSDDDGDGAGAASALIAGSASAAAAGTGGDGAPTAASVGASALPGGTQTSARSTRKRSRAAVAAALADADDEEEGVDTDGEVPGGTAPSVGGSVPLSSAEAGMEVDAAADVGGGSPAGSVAKRAKVTPAGAAVPSPTVAVTVGPAVIDRVLAAINAVSTRLREESFPLDALLGWLAEEEDVPGDADALSAAQVEAALRAIDERGHILYHEKNIFRV
ncbi:hypothetical protein MMPV_009735 [Pyropia vietnamensis]